MNVVLADGTRIDATALTECSPCCCCCLWSSSVARCSSFSHRRRRGGTFNISPSDNIEFSLSKVTKYMGN